MLVFRATNFEILKHIIPHLIIDDDVNKNHVIEYIGSLMMNEPKDICVIVAFDGTELVLDVIGIHREYNDFIWIEQAWANNKKVDKNYSIKCFNMLKTWALDNFGITNFKVQTDRNPTVIERAWNFKICGYLMETREDN